MCSSTFNCHEVNLPAPKLDAKRIPLNEASMPVVGIPGAQTFAQ